MRTKTAQLIRYGRPDDKTRRPKSSEGQKIKRSTGSGTREFPKKTLHAKASTVTLSSKSRIRVSVEQSCGTDKKKGRMPLGLLKTFKLAKSRLGPR